MQYTGILEKGKCYRSVGEAEFQEYISVLRAQGDRRSHSTVSGKILLVLKILPLEV